MVTSKKQLIPVPSHPRLCQHIIADIVGVVKDSVSATHVPRVA